MLISSMELARMGPAGFGRSSRMFSVDIFLVGILPLAFSGPDMPSAASLLMKLLLLLLRGSHDHMSHVTCALYTISQPIKIHPFILGVRKSDRIRANLD